MIWLTGGRFARHVTTKCTRKRAENRDDFGAADARFETIPPARELLKAGEQ